MCKLGSQKGLAIKVETTWVFDTSHFFLFSLISPQMFRDSVAPNFIFELQKCHSVN